MAVKGTSTAERSRSEDKPLPTARLVPMTRAANGGGETTTGKPILFLVHAIGGAVQAYATLAKYLEDTCSVVAIEAFGLRDGHEPVDSLQVIVDRYVETVRAASSGGPYWLGGWSMGGIVAFEMARRFEQEGEDVTFVAILDSPSALTPTALGLDSGGEEAGVGTGEEVGRPSPDGPLSLLARFAEEIADSLGWSVPTTGAAVTDPLSWLATAIAGEVGDEGGSEHVDEMRAELESRYQVFHAHTRALARYTPSGQISADLLLLTPDRSPNVTSVPRWAVQTTGRVHHARVHGDHYSILRPPVVGEIATLVRTASEH